MSKLAFVIAAALSISAIPALAQEKMVVDMRKLTCSQLTKLGFQDFAGLTMWLSGYYNAGIRNTVVDLEQFARAATKVKEFCKTNARDRAVGQRACARNQDAAVSHKRPAFRCPSPDEWSWNQLELA